MLYDLRNTIYHYKNVRWVLKEIVANWCVFSTNLFEDFPVFISQDKLCVRPKGFE